MDWVKRWAAERPRLFDGAVLGCLALFYLGTTVPNIGNNPIVGGDEGWIISGSAKLAETGTFGTDLFAGFFRAEDRYYFNLPLHHLMLAGVFKVFGIGLVQARLVSTAFGLLTLALTYALGRRIGGRFVGLGAAALLVLLRLNLAPFTGLTLTDLGATVRYDLVAVPFALGSALVFLGGKGPPSGRRALVAGLVLGLGCLTQFIDALFVPPFAAFLLLAALLPREKLARLVLFGAGLLLPFLPYFVYIGADWQDFRRQESTNAQQSDVLSPSFYVDNLRHEPDRYDLGLSLSDADSRSGLTAKPSARLVILILGPAALVYAAVRARRGSAPHRLLALTLAALVVEFALFESTKHFVYWVTVVPFLCGAVADAARALFEWRPREVRLRPPVLAAVALAAVVIAIEGAAVGARNVRDARDAPSYAAVSDAVRTLVPAGSTVIADNRMWPGLRDMQVRSLLLLFYWTNPSISEDEATDIPGAFRKIDAGYLLLSPLSREILRQLTPRDAKAFDAFLSEHAALKGTVSQAPYGPIEVYELQP